MKVSVTIELLPSGEAYLREHTPPGCGFEEYIGWAAGALIDVRLRDLVPGYAGVSDEARKASQALALEKIRARNENN